MNLKRARVLISNDDGINAPGLRVLERVAAKMFKEVWVVAPESEQSATSHSLTLRRPLRIRRLAKRRYAVDGTPTDSVLLGVQEVMKSERPDVVLSGINRGGNLGEDISYSGTVAAAMEGTLLGLPSVALSQYYKNRRKVSWKTAEVWMARVLKSLLQEDWPAGVLMNVNFPDVPPGAVTGIQFSRQGRRKIGGEVTEGLDPRGDKYFWVGSQRNEDEFKTGTDLGVVTTGGIAVTPLSMDLTHKSMLKKMKVIVG
ncbi:MAG: 5'/3'-nucleotidase SurE [Magnetovibrio sp.]|nr:5'/3'-nucleotidase SurE [Magnetovibrio sp.]